LGYGFYARALGVFWPLILFSIFGNYVELGFITTLLLIVSLAATIMFGSFFDKKRKNFIKGSFFVAGILWVVRLLVALPLVAYVVDSLYGLVRPSAEISVDATTYSNAGKNAMEYIIYRETVIHTGIIICMLTVIVFPIPQIGLIFAAIGSFLLVFLLK